jgi:arylsulfatase A-like enzyme
LPTDPKELYQRLAASPFGNDLVEMFAEHALQSEQLGKHDVPDILAVSFSSNDYVGHQVGPDAPEVHELAVHTDKLLGQLFEAIDRQVGLGNVLVVMAADHGVAPLPEVNASRHMPGGRVSLSVVAKAIEDALVRKYGDGKWILSSADASFYFNQALISQKKLDPAGVDRTAQQAALEVPNVFRVYTREQLTSGSSLEDQVGRRVLNGFYPRRSADMEVLLEPYWLFAASGTTHGSTFTYDAHVPVIFMGAGIRPGRYYQPIAVNDVAPTLAAILEVDPPSGSVGRVLSEMFSE